MTENLEIAIAAINKWIFHGWNYTIVPLTYKSFGETPVSTHVPAFIRDVKWACNLGHIIEKWKLATESGDPDTYLVKFYKELGNENRIRLLEWIMQNYNDERKLF